jgi:hypothetical protein
VKQEFRGRRFQAELGNESVAKKNKMEKSQGSALAEPYPFLYCFLSPLLRGFMVRRGRVI